MIYLNYAIFYSFQPIMTIKQCKSLHCCNGLFALRRQDRKIVSMFLHARSSIYKHACIAGTHTELWISISLGTGKIFFHPRSEPPSMWSPFLFTIKSAGGRTRAPFCSHARIPYAPRGPPGPSEQPSSRGSESRRSRRDWGPAS